MTAQHQAHPKSEGVGIALGCLSLARGGGGAHDDMGYGRCGTCALAKQAVRVLCEEGGANTDLLTNDGATAACAGISPSSCVCKPHQVCAHTRANARLS